MTRNEFDNAIKELEELGLVSLSLSNGFKPQCSITTLGEALVTNFINKVLAEDDANQEWTDEEDKIIKDFENKIKGSW